MSGEGCRPLSCLRPELARAGLAWAVVRRIHFGENPPKLVPNLGFGAVPIAQLAIERPGRTVELPRVGIVAGSVDLPNVRRQPAIHVMNTEFAADALLDHVAYF